jgi:hypothetical protein
MLCSSDNTLMCVPYCAILQYSDSTPCGACIQLLSTGTGSGAAPPTLGVYLINNQCPECASGSLDFGLSGDGRWAITWMPVTCPISANIGYTFEGSNAYYTKMQVRISTPVVVRRAAHIGCTNVLPCLCTGAIRQVPCAECIALDWSELASGDQN